MSLTNVEIMKETIGLASYEDEWIHNSMVSSSPFGDFIVISSSTCAVFYIKKYVPGTRKKSADNKCEQSNLKVKSTPIFQIMRTYYPICEIAGSITAVCYLPVKVVSSGGRTHDMWHCVVIGYATGLIEIIAAESGDVLLSKQFCKHGGDTDGFSVTSIQYLATASGSNVNVHSSNAYLTDALAIPKLQELIIVMDSTLAVIDSTVLFLALLKSKTEITAIRTSGSIETKKSIPVAFKRYKVREQSKIIDAVAYSVPNVALDQYHQISMKKDLSNEEHLRTLKYITTYVTVGAGPFIQHNCPHQLGPQNINELAANVVSTVKSGLFRAATGFIGSWAGGKTEDDDPASQPDQEQFLHIRHAFKDTSKTAVSIKRSPEGRYLAVLDEHNRVLLLDNNVNGNGSVSGTVVHVWKGYHHAQIGWITTSWEDRKGDKSDKIPQDLEISVLLVLYLPRRGLLEIWSPEQMFRVVEFPVGKHGKLISCTNGLLDENHSPSPLSVRTIGGCIFLEPSGVIKHIYVPVHSLTSKSSSHDTVVRKQLLALAAKNSDDSNAMDQSTNSMETEENPETTKKITDLILSAKSTMGKIEMLIELYHIWDTPDSTDQRIVLEAVASQLSQSKTASERCTMLHDLIYLYDFLVERYKTSCSDDNNKQCDNRKVAVTRDNIITIFDCSTNEADNLLNVYRNSNWNNDETKLDENPTLTFTRFISCFDLKSSSFKGTDEHNDKTKCKIRFKAKSTSVDLKILCQYLAKASYINPEETANIMQSKGIADGHSLIHNFLTTAVRYCNLKDENCAIEWMQSTLRSTTFTSICNLAFSLHETNGDGSSFQALIQGVRQLLVRNNPISFSSYAVTLAWKNYLSGEAKSNEHQRFKSYVGEWQHAMFLMEGFISAAKAADEKLYYHIDKTKNLGTKYTLNDVFNSGDGKVTELFVQWLLDRGTSVSDFVRVDIKDVSTPNSSMDVDTDDAVIKNQSSYVGKSGEDFNLKNFLDTCKEYFPMSSRKDIIICHMAWEYLLRWSNNHRKLDLFTDGAISCLHQITQPLVQHRLTALAWSTFVSKTIIEAVNLTENRSSSRCEREIGFQEIELSSFFDAATKMSRLLVDTSDVDNNLALESNENLSYDDVALTFNISGVTGVKKQHLMDHIRGKVRCSDAEVVAIQYQFVAVASAIWSFGIDTIKPLSLFNSQESNSFFQGSPSSTTFISSSSTFQSLNMFQSEHSRSVRHNRRRFLETACDGAVACIHQIADRELDCKIYESWCNVLKLLAKMWHLPDKLREMQIVSLYRGGHDVLGAELINLLPDRVSIAHKLLHVSLLRLSKHIYFGGIDGTSCPQAEAKAKIASMAITNSNLIKQLESIKNEAAEKLPADSTLKNTSDLLVLLSGFGLEEQSQQLAYECLALAQSLK